MARAVLWVGIIVPKNPMSDGPSYPRTWVLTDLLGNAARETPTDEIVCPAPILWHWLLLCCGIGGIGFSGVAD
jgi:hypothetical protein